MDHIDVITDLHAAKNGDITSNGRANGKKPHRPPDQFPPPPADLWSSNNSLAARDSRGSADMRWDLAGRGEGKGPWRIKSTLRADDDSVLRNNAQRPRRFYSRGLANEPLNIPKCLFLDGHPGFSLL
ncbi:hypothetical protein ElyMa_004830000 [Elysia marginata]|uniref:Uncharacterized protein n=1 Tax=Elysia marginata TaxID=1093978 RepID=A0AAV4IQJ4_9GAST|nr:hypothetical protein ElyMa_004830000 [Elysia marginata]